MESLPYHPVPRGPWAVGVSGGADSVCLLAMLREQTNLALRVVHLDHETRNGVSAEDAAFVRELASQWNLPCTAAKRSEIDIEATGNLSADFRMARMKFFREEAQKHQLRGVILGHHADDQAETVFQRLLRGTSAIGLGGIQPTSTVYGLTVLHPLLSIRRRQLRQELQRRGLMWREDASNQSLNYLRNRVRKIFVDHPALTDAMLDLGNAGAAYRTALDTVAPRLEEIFYVTALRELEKPLASFAARRWLRERGAAGDDLSDSVAERLVVMACDAASPSRQHFPGGLLVRRRQGMIFVDSSSRRS